MFSGKRKVEGRLGCQLRLSSTGECEYRDPCKSSIIVSCIPDLGLDELRTLKSMSILFVLDSCTYELSCMESQAISLADIATKAK